MLPFFIVPKADLICCFVLFCNSEFDFEILKLLRSIQLRHCIDFYFILFSSTLIQLSKLSLAFSFFPFLKDNLMIIHLYFGTTVENVTNFPGAKET